MNPAPARAALFAIDQGSETMRWPYEERQSWQDSIAGSLYSQIFVNRETAMLSNADQPTMLRESILAKLRFFYCISFVQWRLEKQDYHMIQYHKNLYPMQWWMSCTVTSLVHSFFFLQITFSWLTNGSCKYQARNGGFLFSNLILMLFRWRWI